jgi:hypothetical protein
MRQNSGNLAGPVVETRLLRWFDKLNTDSVGFRVHGAGSRAEC